MNPKQRIKREILLIAATVCVAVEIAGCRGKPLESQGDTPQIRALEENNRLNEIERQKPVPVYKPTIEVLSHVQPPIGGRLGRAIRENDREFLDTWDKMIEERSHGSNEDADGPATIEELVSKVEAAIEAKRKAPTDAR